MNESRDLFALLPELEVRKPAVEPERKEVPLEDQPGSIKWSAEKQREYWNLAFPGAKK